MKIIINILFLATFVFASSIFTKEENDWIENNQKVKVSMLYDFQPFSYVEKNEHKGFNIDLLKEISRISGLNFDIQTSNWPQALRSFKSGETDIITDISYTKEREKFTLFTNAYQKIPVYVFGLSDDENYINNNSLVGKKVGVVKNIFYKKELERLGIKIIEFSSVDEKAKALITGKIDYFVTSYPSGIKAINSLSFIDIKPLEEFRNIKKEDLRFGVNKNKKILFSIMEKSLNKIDKNYFLKLANNWILEHEPLNEEINFSKEEKEFIQNSKAIKIGSIDSFIPFSFIENNKKTGFTHELIDIISKKSGLEFEKVGGSWPEVFKKFKNSQIDMVSEISHNEERLAYTNFTKPYYEIPLSVFAREDFGFYKDIKDFEGKTIGCIANSYFSKVLKKMENVNVIEYSSNDDKLFALNNKEVDAIISSLSVVYRIEQLMLSDVKQVGIFTHKQTKNEDLRFGINKSNPILFSIINKTLNSISFSKITKLKQKWILEGFELNLNLEQKKEFINLTIEEKDYIDKIDYITYSEVNWKPLSIIENKQMRGIMGDYLDIVSLKTGIKFKYIHSNTWSEVLEKFKNKEIDLIPGIGTSSQELKLGLVSSTYSDYPMVIVTGSKINYIKDLNELEEKTIAVPKNYTSYNFLIKNYPKIKLIETDNIKEALLLVESNKANAFVGHIATTMYHISQLHLKNLKISGITDFKFKHKYLIQKDNHILLSIINKAFRSISEIEKKKIHSKWVQPFVVKESVNYTIVYTLIFVFIFVLLVVLYILNIFKKQKKEFKTIFETSKDAIGIVDLNLSFLEFNDAYENLLHLTKEELKSLSLVNIISNEYKADIFNAIEEVNKKGYLKNFETVYLNRFNKRINVNMTISMLPDKKRFLLVTKDVTSIKHFENNLKLVSMGEMIGNIAHQWRQPLSVITSSASGMRITAEYLGSISKEEVRSFSDNILEQANYLSKTIDDFKDFIKGSKEFNTIDVLDVVNASLSLTNANCKENFVNIVTDLESSIKIEGNKNELEQVLINIINNAKDALLENRDEKSRYIFLSSKKLGDDSLELKIYDNAGGIPEKILNRVFEPYFTTKHKSIGTGLGLSIVDKIIRERHKQSISVFNDTFVYENKKYKGACFSIVFRSNF